MQVTGGDTNVAAYFMVRLAADGTAATGLTVTNFDLQYTRTLTAAATKIDGIVGTGGAATHVDNKVFEIDATSSPGLYLVCFPDAAFTAGVPEVILALTNATDSVFAEAIRCQIDAPVTLADNALHGGAATVLTFDRMVGVSTSDSCVHLTGLGGGAGIEIIGGATNGPGLQVQGGVTGGHGATFTGAGGGEGIAAQGGSSGSGMSMLGGATSGAGLFITAISGNSAGISSTGIGNQPGFLCTGGATGEGVSIIGGSTSGSAVKIEATGTNDHGVEIIGIGTSHGIASTGGADGHGCQLTGGVTSGDCLDLNLGGGAFLTTGCITANAMATDSIDAAALASDALDEIEARADAALVSIDLDHLSFAGAAPTPTAGSNLADIMGATFATSTDSLEQIRNNLADAALVTSTTTSAGTTTTLIDSALTEADDYWNDLLLVIQSGTEDNQTALVTDFDAASDTITFSPATLGSVASGVTYSLYRWTNVKLADDVTHGGTECIYQGAQVAITPTASDTPAVLLTGNGNQPGLQLTGGATSGEGLNCLGGAPNGNGAVFEGDGSATGLTIRASQSAGTGIGLNILGGSTSGDCIKVSSAATNAIGINVDATGTGDALDLSSSGSGSPLAASTIDAQALATDTITAAKIAADAIGSSELATTAVNEIRDSILSDSTPFAGANIDEAISADKILADSALHGGAATVFTFDRALGTSTSGACINIIGQGTGAGVDITGGGTNGDGVEINGGATNGIGIDVNGAGSGIGFDVSSVSSTGMQVSSGSSNGVGMLITAAPSGSGDGLQISGGQAGGTGNGLNIVAGNTSGDAVRLLATNGGNPPNQLVPGTIAGSVTSAGTATVFDTDLTEAVDDFYNDGVMVFTTGNLEGSHGRITDYDGTGTVGEVTIQAGDLTAAPDNGSFFMLVGRATA